MKILSPLLTTVVILGVLFGLYKYIERQTYQEHRENMNRYADFTIFLEENIQELDSVQLNICDSIYQFPIAAIQDTVFDKLLTESYQPPCAVSMNYIFEDKSVKTFSVENFGCLGCSGTNRYLLYQNSVVYQYHP